MLLQGHSTYYKGKQGPLQTVQMGALRGVYIQRACVCLFVDVCVVTVPCTLGPFSRSYRCYLTKPTQTLCSSFSSFVLFRGRQEAMEVPDQTGGKHTLYHSLSCFSSEPHIFCMSHLLLFFHSAEFV